MAITIQHVIAGDPGNAGIQGKILAPEMKTYPTTKGIPNFGKNKGFLFFKWKRMERKEKRKKLKIKGKW